VTLPLALTALMFWLPSTGAAETTGQTLVDACSCLVGGDLTRAEQLFAEVIGQDRLCAEAVAGRAAAQLLRGETLEARRSFKGALVLSPSLACAHTGAGTASCLLGDHSSALSQFRSALRCPPRRPALALAGEAYAACALGLYDTALQRSSAALGTDPHQPLANYVFAAASLARGTPGPAAALDTQTALVPRVTRPPIFLDSCLLSPGTVYWDTYAAAHASGLSDVSVRPAPAAVDLGAPQPVRSSPDFQVSRPSAGDVLSEGAIVAIQAADALELDYVIVRVNNSFAGISSARPFKVALNTRLLGDGAATIRADGYNTVGQVIATAAVTVKIQNGSRTLAPAEKAARAAVRELLEELLVPSVSPVAVRQLAGHGLLQSGQAREAAECFEGAYATDPRLPALRADLLRAYSALGVPMAEAAPEIVTLGAHSKRVAITFDDGPHPLITPWILDQLDKERVKATFFLVGKQATLYPELVREIKRRDHQIGSHSYAHYSLRHMTGPECEQDLVKSRLALREACGETVRLFRPPGGYYDDVVKRAAGNLGFSTAFWTANITSFPGRDGKRIAQELARQCADGGIILLHNGEDETLDTLPYLIPELRKHGVTFVTLRASDAGIASDPRMAERGR